MSTEIEVLTCKYCASSNSPSGDFVILLLPSLSRASSTLVRWQSAFWEAHNLFQQSLGEQESLLLDDSISILV